MRGTVRLEPVGMEHAARVQELASDPEVQATTRLPEPYPPDGARQFITATILRRAAGEEYAFAVISDRDGVVGMCGLSDVRRAAGRAELGYWIGRPYWGLGYASAAVAQAVRVAFTELGLIELEAHALADNMASRRVLEKAGFRFVGLGTHSVPKWSADRLVACYHLTRAPDLGVGIAAR
jgi:RimJ/RimL family protein N-acetyltransferase